MNAPALTIDFANEVRDWIAGNLAKGCQPEVVVRSLVEQKTDQALAIAMVQAVSNALLFGDPMPEGKLTLGAPPPQYAPDASMLGEAAVLRADGREVPVLARLRRPGVAVLGNVFDDDDCAALIEQARPRLEKSTITDPITGLDRVASHRTSSGMFFRLGETPLVARLEQRIAALTGAPLEHGEGLQILYYPVGAECAPHFDFLMPVNDANKASIARSGQRIATFITYLNNVEAGGETTFPHMGMSVSPRRGQALFFEYGNARKQTDPLSLHAGAPVQAGEKWIAVKWLRRQRFIPASGGAAEGSAY
ncbi:MAG: 2OG-Fe(II) oxygenase [Gallionellaceae bacterium]|jgi:prolyl 4-hydroxylase|nr:2OG-Fe(II) oxygenase [Gallionellaceae bacterium]